MSDYDPPLRPIPGAIEQHPGPGGSSLTAERLLEASIATIKLKTINAGGPIGRQRSGGHLFESMSRNMSLAR